MIQHSLQNQQDPHKKSLPRSSPLEVLSVESLKALEKEAPFQRGPHTNILDREILNRNILLWVDSFPTSLSKKDRDEFKHETQRIAIDRQRIKADERSELWPKFEARGRASKETQEI